jgi:glucose/arabinose dehydrogenase
MPERRRRLIRRPMALIVATLSLLGAALSGCVAGGDPDRVGASGSAAPGSTGRAPEVALPASAVRTIATGLRIPWGLAFLPDGTALVTERASAPFQGEPNPPPDEPGVPRILSVTAEGKVTEVQRLPDARSAEGGVQTDNGEGGLLGIAVSPNYAKDKWVYVYYTTEDDNRIARFRLGQPPQPILTGIPADTFHNGGRIAFGPDGMLYATTGETHGTPDIAQDPESLGGKILRITPDGRPAPGNPFPGSPVWSLGHRNVQGLAWDARGRMYASELGEDLHDELNIIQPGRNYGWPVVQGAGGDRRFVNPIATWAPSEASPSGITIVGDRVYIACLRGRRLYRVGLDGRRAEALLVGDYGRLRTVARAPDGRLWVLTTNRDGGSDAEPTAQDDRILLLNL